jgi:diacylglycerol kinase (ATP)
MAKQATYSYNKAPYAKARHASGEPLLNYHRVPCVVGRWLSLSAALRGAFYTLRTQPNAWIELAAIVTVGGAGLWFGISALEWAVLVLTSATILALEAMNTAIETVVDMVSPQYHPLARVAKDTAAGAMIIAVLGSLGVAIFIFGPRVWALIFG